MLEILCNIQDFKDKLVDLHVWVDFRERLSTRDGDAGELDIPITSSDQSVE